MTEQVQPLTLQKTTNLEEHNQFFNKINEIIDNLAPTVAEAEAATASAEQAIADAETAIGNANTAISTANTAVSTANAASTQAQAAASTVAGYNARLTVVENSTIRTYSSNVQTIDSDLQIVNGHDLAVAGDVNIASQVIAEGAEIAGMAVEKSGAKTVLSNEDGITVTGTVAISVEDTATGIRTAAAVNGRRLQNDLDAYEHMIRTTGSQIKNGSLTFTPLATNPLIIKRTNDVIGTTPASNIYSGIAFNDANDAMAVNLLRYHYTNGQAGCALTVKGEGGESASLQLQINPDGGGFVRVQKPDGSFQNITTW